MSTEEAFYVGLIAIFALGVWVVTRSGNPNALLRGSFGELLKTRMPTRREELLTARAQVKHQLDVQPVRNRMNDPEIKQELQQILAEIEAELAETLPDHQNKRGLKS